MRPWVPASKKEKEIETMSSNVLPDDQIEARHQVQQAIDCLFLIWKRQNECSRRMFAAKRESCDVIQLRDEMYRLCHQYTEQDDRLRLLEEAYRDKFNTDLEPFRTFVNLDPN